jgi:two-component system, chemotaxis family, protein-glutamate methylesterase/glutaminase
VLNEPETLDLSAPHRSAPPIRVLVVDDSAVVRQVFTRELSCDPRIQVVATAPDVYVARDRIVALRPDIITLDINMPRMDGITFLKRLMKHHPMPVIVISSLTTGGGLLAIEAMAAGAVDVLAKPSPSDDSKIFFRKLIDKMKSIAKSRIRYPAISDGQLPSRNFIAAKPTRDLIFALGASTGGVQALTQILSMFPADAPGTLVVQHMPAEFTASFAERLNAVCQMQVKEAAHRDRIARGHILIAPGGFHMVLRRSNGSYHVELNQSAEVCRQRPSVDVLFDSVAQCAGSNAVGVILTGMGTDGAQGLRHMRQAGAHTIVQDEPSSIVFGMPMEAIKCGAAEAIVPLDQVAVTMMRMAQQPANTGQNNPTSC